MLSQFSDETPDVMTPQGNREADEDSPQRLHQHAGEHPLCCPIPARNTWLPPTCGTMFSIDRSVSCRGMPGEASQKNPEVVPLERGRPHRRAHTAARGHRRRQSQDGGEAEGACWARRHDRQARITHARSSPGKPDIPEITTSLPASPPSSPLPLDTLKVGCNAEHTFDVCVSHT